jgi:hypothetical protein
MSKTLKRCPMCKREVEARHFGCVLAASGGAGGTGAAKRRGDSDYYRALSAKGVARLSARLAAAVAAPAGETPIPSQG